MSAGGTGADSAPVPPGKPDARGRSGSGMMEIMAIGLVGGLITAMALILAASAKLIE